MMAMWHPYYLLIPWHHEETWCFLVVSWCYLHGAAVKESKKLQNPIKELKNYKKTKTISRNFYAITSMISM